RSKFGVFTHLHPYAPECCQPQSSRMINRMLGREFSAACSRSPAMHKKIVPTINRVHVTMNEFMVKHPPFIFVLLYEMSYGMFRTTVFRDVFHLRQLVHFGKFDPNADDRLLFRPWSIFYIRCRH